MNKIDVIFDSRNNFRIPTKNEIKIRFSKPDNTKLKTRQIFCFVF